MRFVSFTVTLGLAILGTVLVSQNVPAQDATAPKGEQAQTMPADQREVLLVLRQLAHAQINRDVATFRRLTADNFLQFDPDGSSISKQDWLRILEDEPPRLATPAEPLDAPVKLTPGTVVRVVGTTAVVVTTPAPLVKDQSTRVVTVLVKQDGAWQQLLVNRQVNERVAVR
jgi:hypothetical protein